MCFEKWNLNFINRRTEDVHYQHLQGDNFRTIFRVMFRTMMGFFYQNHDQN